MASRRNKTPAQARRHALAETAKARGHSPYNLWLVRPPFDSEDLLLTSDIAFELFYFLEGDPQYVSIDYPNLKASGGAAAVSIANFIFAEVKDTDGKVLQIKFKHRKKSDESTDADTETASDIRIVTIEDLNANVQRVENWRRIVPCIRRVRLHPIATLERQILQLLRNSEPKPIDDILQALPEEQVPKVLGAIATVLRKRYIFSDVDAKPWSLNTLVWSVVS
jgi:hypothetical protein